MATLLSAWAPMRLATEGTSQRSTDFSPRMSRLFGVVERQELMKAESEFRALSSKVALLASYFETPVELQRAIDNTRARALRQPTIAAHDGDLERVQTYLAISESRGWDCR